MEQREKQGSVSLKNLDEVAKAFGLRLTYGFYSPDKDLKKMIDDRAYKVAEQIVARTHKTMQLENQANSKARLKRAIKERAKEIIDKNIKRLWD
jgi:F0F1-type ATP synthase membrane subunit b/b'